MTAQVNTAPVIIKRKKVIGGGGHHGGAWKVAIRIPSSVLAGFTAVSTSRPQGRVDCLSDLYSPLFCRAGTVPPSRGCAVNMGWKTLRES